MAIRQMASGAAAASRFRGCGSGADRCATLVKTPGGEAVGVDGAIFATGVLRPSALLFCRTHAYGQCVHAERLAAIRAFGRNVRCDAGHGKAFLEERSQARTPAKTSSRSWNANHLAAARSRCAGVAAAMPLLKSDSSSAARTHRTDTIALIWNGAPMWNRVRCEISPDVKSQA